jgi:hypothetical protein
VPKTAFWAHYLDKNSEGLRRISRVSLFEPITLTGRHVILEPLRRDHHDGLVAAAQDGELWRLWYTSVPTPDGMAAEIDRRLALQEQGSMLPFTTRLMDPATGGPGEVIGMTTYMNIDAGTPAWRSAPPGTRRRSKAPAPTRIPRSCSSGTPSKPLAALRSNSGRTG